MLAVLNRTCQDLDFLNAYMVLVLQFVLYNEMHVVIFSNVGLFCET